MSFDPISVLDPRSNSSKYCSMDVYPAVVAGRIKTRVRLDFVTDPALFAGGQNPIFEKVSDVF
jgi:hypothetical protein